MWRNINDRGGGKLDFVWLTSRLPGLRRGAIELYNCPDQETNDPESGRSWAIFKPGELKHILEEKTSWFSFMPHVSRSDQSSLMNICVSWLSWCWSGCDKLPNEIWQTRDNTSTGEKFRSIIVMTRSSSLKSFILGWEELSITVSEPRRSV